LSLPSNAPDENLSVVVLELDGTPDVDPLSLQQPNGSVTLIPSMAELHGPKDDGIAIAMTGMTRNWYKTDRFASWQFKVNTPGTFKLRVITGPSGFEGWKGGHRISVKVANASLETDITPDEKIESINTHYFPEFATVIGSVGIDSPGVYELTLEALDIDPENRSGLTVESVTLT
jgi:hypothetical protein